MRFCESLSRNWYSRNCCSPPLLVLVRICDSYVKLVTGRSEPTPPEAG